MQRAQTRVVVTGASGFVGAAILRLPEQHNMHILGVSRGVHQNLMTVANYADAPEGDVLIHLAETNDRAFVNAQGERYLERAKSTMARLLDRGYSRAIYASSAVLYGEDQAYPHRETDKLVLDDTYARTKAALECAVLEAGGAVARLTNLIGPGMSEKNVASAILAQLGASGPILLRDVAPVRDFLWVDDAAEALLSMALSNSPGVFNVGTGHGVSIETLARGILHAAEQSNRPIQSQLLSTKLSHLVVDTSAVLETFGWKASTDLRSAMERLVNQAAVERR